MLTFVIPPVQIDVGYKLPYISLLGSMGLTAQPKVVLAATTGKNNVVVGGEATYDTRTAAVTKWHAGAGYTGLDYQLAGLLTDNGTHVWQLVVMCWCSVPTVPGS